jgi:hypothetical protein
LFDALTKSAYDAAVYDLQLFIPRTDKLSAQIAQVKNYYEAAVAVYERTLGSRGQDK